MANKIQKLKNSTNDTIYPVTVKDAIYDNLGNPLSIADTASVVAVDAKVGDLSLLTTTKKTSAVNAINEVDSDVTSLVNTVNGINSNINAVDNKIGLLSALQTIDKTDVVSAINENSSAIGQIAVDRGYVTTKEALDFNLAITNGKYSAYNPLNAPILGGYTWTLEVVKEASGVISQIIHCIFGAPAGRIFSRYLSGTWSAWKEIATTEKYTMQASDMRNGWALGYGNIIQKIGNRVFARFIVNSGVTTVDTVVCNFPVGFRPIAETFVTVRTYVSQTENPVNQFVAIYPDGNAQIRLINSKLFIFIEESWEV